MHAMVNKGSLGDNFQGSVVSFYPVGPGTTAKLPRFSRKRPKPGELSHDLCWFLQEDSVFS